MPPKRKTIQDIKPSRSATSARKRVAKTKDAAIKTLSKEGIFHIDKPAPVKKKKKKETSKNPPSSKSIWVLVGVAFIFFVITFSLLFSGASIVLTPESVIAPEGEITLEAEKDGTKNLSFQTISVKGERSQEVESDGFSSVDRLATGIVTLYNNHSSKPQNLLIDTRLISSTGKIYKTKKATVVPGQKSVDGKTVPGQVDVEVYSDTLGESGNLGMSDFSILGFKGTSKEKTFYGRSKTEILGGFTGNLYSLSSEAGYEKQLALQSLLKDELMSKLKAQIPDGFILVEGSEKYKSDNKNDYYESDTSLINIFEAGEMIGVIIDKDNLAKAIAKDFVVDYVDGTDVYIENISNLIVSIKSITADIDSADKLEISVSGKPFIVWSLDEDRIKYDLIKTRKKQFETIMAKYEYVKKANLKVRPFWKSSLPDEIEDIDIIYKLD